MSPAQVVRSLFTDMQARDWEAAAARLSPDVTIRYTASGERFDGPNFIAMNRAYPEGWTIEVVDTLDAGPRVSAQVRVDHGVETFWCAGFYTVEGGVITEGVEHWVTAGADAPPAWRRPFTTSEP